MDEGSVTTMRDLTLRGVVYWRDALVCWELCPR